MNLSDWQCSYKRNKRERICYILGMGKIERKVSGKFIYGYFRLDCIKDGRNRIKENLEIRMKMWFTKWQYS